METIDVSGDTGDDEDDDDGAAQMGCGLCIKCGQVSKPHSCPYGAKVMKRASKSRMASATKRQKTSAAAASSSTANYAELFGDDDDDDEPAASALPLVMPAAVTSAAGQDTSAFGMLSQLITQHGSMQTEIAQQKCDIASVTARETAANKAVQQAATEVTRLQGELAKKDKTIADQQKQLQTSIPKPKGKGKAAAAAAAVAATAAGLAPAKDGYLQLMADAMKQYVRDQGGRAEEEALAAGAVAFAVPATWYYDNSTPPTPWKPAWVPIADSNLISNLESLGVATKDATGATTAFTPTVGSTASYTIGQHKYTASVVNAPAPQAPAAPPPPPPPPPPKPWQDDMLFAGDFFKLPKRYLDTCLTGYHFDAPDSIAMKSVEVAELAEQWSSYAQGFEYDPNKSELWVKPNWLHFWLRAAKERGYNEARILMHGVRSQNYHLLAKDLSGFDFNFSNQGAKKWGFYASCSDHIASDYNASGGGSFPDGTGVIGLLLIKRNAGLGAYEHYHLGSHRGGPSSYQVNDAYAVRDQTLWLPFGLAYAKAP
eukprot:gene12656-14962_t